MDGVIRKVEEMTRRIIRNLGYLPEAPMAERIRGTIREFMEPEPTPTEAMEAARDALENMKIGMERMNPCILREYSPELNIIRTTLMEPEPTPTEARNIKALSTAKDIALKHLELCEALKASRHGRPLDEHCPDMMDAAVEKITRLRARFTAPIVCMCGSTRFKQTWLSENARLTYEGNIVLSVGLCAHADGKMVELESTGMKVKLDALHKRKIDLCDWVWVLDVGGYIGESTRSEIAYAEAHGKPVRYLSMGNII